MVESDVKYEDIEIDKVDFVENLRTEGREDLAQLMESIKENGLLQPIGVYRLDDRYILCYGFRRLEACRKLGYKKIPALVSKQKLSEQDFLIYNTVENIQRKDIQPIELGRIITRLHEDMGLSFGEIKARLSITQNAVSNALVAYQHVPEEFRHLIGNIKGVKRGKIPASTTALILRDRFLLKEQKKELLSEVSKNEYSLKDIGLIIALLSHEKMTIKTAKANIKAYRVITPSVVINKEVMKNLCRENACNTTAVIRGMLSGKIPLNKKLLFEVD